MTGSNPIIWMDYPDLDVIRVENTYYMVSTTMHFFPGGAILKSNDLIHWEIATYIFESIDETPGQCLEDGKGVYGKGMWAASIRYHKGIFYVCFVCNDTGKTYLYQAEDITGPWKKQNIEGFYHDCSLLFDDDDSVYIMYGNRQIYITELNEDLTGPKENGLHRMILEDGEDYMLGLEGSHLYKINGKYYAFFIHWSKAPGARRQEACYVSDSLTGEFLGKNVLDDDLNFRNSGIAQGGIVDTPDGSWYAMLFQDHGAIGRIPILVPVSWEDDFPVFGIDGKAPASVEIASGCDWRQTTGKIASNGESILPTADVPGDNNSELSSASAKNTSNCEKTRGIGEDNNPHPLWGDDNFNYKNGQPLKLFWQWNHQPDLSMVDFEAAPNNMRITTARTSINLTKARNILTQRPVGPYSKAEITVDASHIKVGDYCGICAFGSRYAGVALHRSEEGLELVYLRKAENPEGQDSSFIGGTDELPPEIVSRIPAGTISPSLHATELAKKAELVDLSIVNENNQATTIPASSTMSNPATARLQVEFFFGDQEDYAVCSYFDGQEFKQIGDKQPIWFTLDHFTGYRFGLFIYSEQEAGGYADFKNFKMEMK